MFRERNIRSFACFVVQKVGARECLHSVSGRHSRERNKNTDKIKEISLRFGQTKYPKTSRFGLFLRFPISRTILLMLAVTKCLWLLVS